MSSDDDLTQLKHGLDQLTLVLEQNAAALARTRRQLQLAIAALALSVVFALFLGLRGPEAARAESAMTAWEKKVAAEFKSEDAKAKAHFDRLIDQLRTEAHETGEIEPVKAIAVLLRDMRNALESMPRMAADMDSMARDMTEMNGKMSAVPVMATEMQRMNVQMGIMAHGVDSTMGRMGNWMPWRP